MLDAQHLELWAAFAVVATLMSLTPGPAVLFVVGQGVWRGPMAALKANAAINAINTLNFILAGFGLAAIFALSDFAFTALKWIGAVYLMWLGIRAFRRSFEPHEARIDKPGRPFIDGLIVQGSNPKAFLFMGAILPQFIDQEAALPPQLGALWVISLITEFGVLAGYGLLAGLIRKSADRLPTARAWLERIGGVILIIVAVATALYERGGASP